MSIDTDLRARLRDLADDGPPHGGFSGADLWRSGVRRQRRRAAGAVAAVAAVVALVAGVGSVVELPRPAPPPADVPFRDLAIPRTVHPPDPWSEGTAELGPPGRLAAVGDGRRLAPDGFAGTRLSQQLFGVSAVDGTARFLDLPTEPGTVESLGNFGVALSPDGTKVGYVLQDGTIEEPGGIIGWNVYDTVTGETVELRVPGLRTVHGTDAFEIEFTGDSRHLLTNFSLSGSDGSRDDSLVVWDVETGDHQVAEQDGFYWLPNPGSGPSGVVWGRGRSVHSFDPATGETSELRLPNEVYEPWYSPDGRSLAYVGAAPTPPGQAAGPERLHVSDANGGAHRTLDVGIRPGDVLGWRSPTEVVVSHYGPRQVRTVDITTGEVEPMRLDRTGSHGMLTEYASDLWAHDLVAGTVQPDAHDPRVWLRWWFWTGAAGVLLLVGLLLWRRRGRA